MVSMLVAVVGIYLRRMIQGELNVPVARMLQLLPVMTMTIIGLVALFLFAYPYNYNP